MSPERTLLSREPVAPICLLGVLVSELGCEVSWSDRRFRLKHPRLGFLDTKLEGQRPTVTEDMRPQLIGEIESGRRQVGLRKTFLSGVTSQKLGFPATGAGKRHRG